VVLADRFVLGQRLSALAYALILGGICVPLLILSALRAFGWFRQGVGITTAFYVHIGAVFLAVLALSTGDGAEPPFLYVALLIHCTATYFVSGLRLAPSCLIGFGLCFAYLIVETLVGLSAVALWESGLFLFAANIAGASARYVMESLERRQFLTSQLLKELASHDALTGALNRVAFEDGLNTAWRQAIRERAPVMLGVLDVDYFKKFNDKLGHARGDELLLAVAQALREAAQRPLDLLSRFGGDEFVCLWYGVPADKARDFLQTIHQALNDGIAAGLDASVGAKAPRVSVSLGAIHVEASEDIEPISLFASADAALYTAKEAGRKRAAICWKVGGESTVL
jgi:diguanylate cyclase (GGDEF)-like protein